MGFDDQKKKQQQQQQQKGTTVDNGKMGGSKCTVKITANRRDFKNSAV